MKTDSILLKHAGTSEKSLRQRVLDGVFWLAVVKICAQVISWTITVYVVRILSPNDYGLMAMVGLYLSSMIVLNEMGLGAAIIQKKDLTQEDLSNIYWAVLAINVGLYVVSVLLAPVIAAFFNESRLTSMIRVASITFILNSVGLVSYNMLTREMNFNRRSQAEMIGNVSGALSTLWLAMHGFGVWSLVWGNLIIEVAKNLLYLFFYPWKLKFSFSFSKIKDMTHFGFKVALAQMFWYLSSNSKCNTTGPDGLRCCHANEIL
jgi:O-antigen/teichoic acid export membrane protein